MDEAADPSAKAPAKPDLRAARIAATEDRILHSANELFLERGYAATTLAAVADHAQVGARTVYVRFGTKAALLKRTVDVAFAGDTADIDLGHRDWFTSAATAPTAAERLTALAAGCRHMFARAGDILAVALQASATEPDLATASQAGREATHDNMRGFWTKLAADGLLPPGLDIAWLTDTSALLTHAETYLLARRMNAWTLDTYQDWLTATLLSLIAPTSMPTR